MEHIQPFQRTLDFRPAMSWPARRPGPPRMHVVSAGHAGVDRAALDTALALGMTGDATSMGVRDSDATLILTLGVLDRGSRVTASLARRLGKPCLVVQLDDADALETARAWMSEVDPRVLNVAGPRGSRPPGVYGRAYAFLSRLLKRGQLPG
jgi:hypothetical protein